MSRPLAYRIRAKMEESAPSVTWRGVATSVPVREATLESPATKTEMSAQKVAIHRYSKNITLGNRGIIIGSQILVLLVRA